MVSDIFVLRSQTLWLWHRTRVSNQHQIKCTTQIESVRRGKKYWFRRTTSPIKRKRKEITGRKQVPEGKCETSVKGVLTTSSKNRQPSSVSTSLAQYDRVNDLRKFLTKSSRWKPLILFDFRDFSSLPRLFFSSLGWEKRKFTIDLREIVREKYGETETLDKYTAD